MEEILNNYIENEFDESEEDASFSIVDSLDNLTTIPLDISMELVAEWKKKGKLNTDPKFQRREVWDVKKMSRFIESLILGVPIPSVLLADDKKNNKYIVIDGKQRLNSIINFLALDKNGIGLKLKGLEILTKLNNCTYSKLQSNGELSNYLYKFQDAILKCSVVKNYNEDQLYFIFNRLNTGSVPLSTQELRQTLYPGEFLNYINDFSFGNLNVRKILNINAPDKRMKDVELLVRFFAFKYFREDYQNNINKFFNYTCETLNNKWETNSNQIKEDCHEFDNSINFVYEHLGKDSFRAYLQNTDTKEWKFGPINRPMYDLLAVVFSVESNRNIITSRNINLKEFIIELFTQNERFYDAFLPTTHSKEKTDRRFDLFLEKLNSI